MSRKYLNERWCVRCQKTGPTPFLRDNWKKLLPAVYSTKTMPMLGVVDIGCGNGRNLKFLHTKGLMNTVAFDMVNDFGFSIKLGQDPLPLLARSVDIVLANYVFMFLDEAERIQVLANINRVAKPGCKIMVELYPAKDSFAKTEKAALKMQTELYADLRWHAVKYNKLRFIAEKP